MLKKICILILICTLFFTLTACGRNAFSTDSGVSNPKNGGTAGTATSGSPNGATPINPSATPFDQSLQLESAAPQAESEESMDNLYNTLDDLDKLMDSLNDISDDNLVIPEPTD